MLLGLEASCAKQQVANGAASAKQVQLRDEGHLLPEKRAGQVIEIRAHTIGLLPELIANSTEVRRSLGLRGFDMSKYIMRFRQEVHDGNH